MEPEFFAGDMLIFDPAERLKAGDFAVVALNTGKIVCGRYSQTGQTVRLERANPAYPPEEHPASEVRWAFPVVEMSRKLRDTQMSAAALAAGQAGRS